MTDDVKKLSDRTKQIRADLKRVTIPFQTGVHFAYLIKDFAHDMRVSRNHLIEMAVVAFMEKHRPGLLKFLMASKEPDYNYDVEIDYSDDDDAPVI